MAEGSLPYFAEKWLTLPVDLPETPRGYALDIGGSLAKLTYISDSSQVEDQKKGIRIRMLTVKTEYLPDLLNFVKKEALGDKEPDDDVIGVGTGVGCLSSKEQIADTLGSSFSVLADEFAYITKALHYGIRHIPREEFVEMPFGEPEWLTEARTERKDVTSCTDQLFPALVSCLGSATSIQRVQADGKSTLVGGSIRGGLYAYSVGKLLTQCKDFEELQDLAKKGDSTNVNVTLQETLQQQYGDMDCRDLEQKYPFIIDLFPFGKIIHQKLESPSREDIAAAWMSNCYHDYVEIATMSAHVYRRDMVYFCGSVVTDNEDFREKSVEMVFYNKFLQIDQVTVYPAIIKIGGYMTAFGGLLLGLETWMAKRGLSLESQEKAS